METIIEEGAVTPPLELAATFPKKRRHSFMQNALAFSGVNVFLQGVNFVSGFLLRHFLVPEVMGTWNLIALIRSYLQPISLGAVSGAFRELPILSGKGDLTEAEHVRSVSFTFAMLEVLMMSVGLIAAAIYRFPSHSRLEFYALIATALLIATARVQEIYQTFFQGAQAYVPLSRIMLLTNVVLAAAMPLGAWIGGIPGLLVAAVAGELFLAFWMMLQGFKSHLSVRIWLNKAIWKRLVSYGISYRITDYPLSVFMKLDLVWVTKFMGLKGLGIYALAKSVYTMISEMTSRISVVMYTRALQQYGESVHGSKIAIDMRRFVEAQLLVCVPFVCWGTMSVAPLLIRHVIPKYVESIPVLLLITLCCFFNLQNNLLLTDWIAKKRMVAYGISNLVGLAFVSGSLATFWFVLHIHTLNAIAGAMVVGLTGYFAYMVASAGIELWGKSLSIRVFLEICSAMIWTGVVMRLFAVQFSALDLRQDLILSAKRSLEMLIAMLPLFIYGVEVSEARRFIDPVIKKFSL